MHCMGTRKFVVSEKKFFIHIRTVKQYPVMSANLDCHNCKGWVYGV